MFQFTDEMRTEIEHIDSQHKELVELVNHAAVLGETNPDRGDMKSCLDFLGEYVVKHFGDEEKLQVDSSYPNYVQHKTIHDNFIETFQELYADFENNIPMSKLTFVLSTTVSHWLITHIKSEDVKFGRYFARVARFDLFESKDGGSRLVFSAFPISALPNILATHYAIDIEHAKQTAGRLAQGEECPPFGYISRVLTLKYRRIIK
ncbi:MAG: bacteriohemerythrin [Peptococcaceae bacterium]|nr:bacteriohemerythrin [Peptococcaceae bacterium]